MSTQTLTEFLLARIAEDEGDAHMHECNCDSYLEDAHFAFCPDRVWAEAAAKRRIVERHGAVQGGRGRWAEADGLAFALTALALPYADHPAFRPEWRA